MIRVLVADDQPMARERLVSLLAAEPGVELAGTASTGEEAVDQIRQSSPDLVFLDLQMPGMDGFQVIETIGVDRMPPTVFVTAYDEYAVRAFDVQALDYLLKPFGRQRFQSALERARKHLERERKAKRADWRNCCATASPQSREHAAVDQIGWACVVRRRHQIDWSRRKATTWLCTPAIRSTCCAKR